MGRILVYQKNRQIMPDSAGQSRWLDFAADLEQAARRLERDHYRMILIHFENGEKSGLSVASLVRGMPAYHLTPMVFVAADRRYEEMAFYEYHCYDYLVKQIHPKEFVRILYPFLVQLYTEKKENWMRVRIRGSAKEICVNDILYLESANRSVMIHTRNGVLEIPYLSLKQCLEDHGGVFVQCHRCVLVNRNFIERIDYRERRIELPGCRVDIGRRYEAALHREFDAHRGLEENKEWRNQ